METNEAGQLVARFYNAGSKIDEFWSFSISPTAAGFNTDDNQGAHSIGKWNLIAPERGWFLVPLEIVSGNETMRVNFPEDLKRKFGARGIVMLDPRHNPAKEDPEKPLEQFAMAPTEELVIERAEALWDQYLERICSAHFEDVQNAMAGGNRPRAASGFTVRALKLKGYRDPAADFLQGMREGKNAIGQAATSPEMVGIVRAMQEQNKLLTTLVMAVASGQKVDPELLKSALAPSEGPAPQPSHAPMEPPINAGTIDVDGIPHSGLEARINRREDGWVKGEGNLDKGNLRERAEPLRKGDRGKVAAKALEI